MNLLSLFKRNKGKTDVKSSETKCYVGSDNVKHYYPDCSMLFSPLSEIALLDAYKYKQCSMCHKRKANHYRRGYRKLRRNSGKVLNQFAENISNSNLSEKDKEGVWVAGLVGLKLSYMISALTVGTFIKPRRKHLNIEKVRKSIQYAKGDMPFFPFDSIQNITIKQKDAMISRIRIGIDGALLNSGGHGNMEAAIKHIGHALEAMVVLDYQHTKLNPPKDGRLGDDVGTYVDFCTIRRSLDDEIGYNECDMNREYNEIMVEQRMRLKH